jgi:hypothetical protein
MRPSTYARFAVKWIMPFPFWSKIFRIGPGGISVLNSIKSPTVKKENTIGDHSSIIHREGLTHPIGENGCGDYSNYPKVPEGVNRIEV